MTHRLNIIIVFISQRNSEEQSMTLDSVLGNDILGLEFREALKRDLCCENILFYESAKCYRKMDEHHIDTYEAKKNCDSADEINLQ